jgi:hypothetical protein
MLSISASALVGRSTACLGGSEGGGKRNCRAIRRVRCREELHGYMTALRDYSLDVRRNEYSIPVCRELYDRTVVPSLRRYIRCFEEACQECDDGPDVEDDVTN